MALKHILNTYFWFIVAIPPNANLGFKHFTLQLTTQTCYTIACQDNFLIALTFKMYVPQTLLYMLFVII